MSKKILSARDKAEFVRKIKQSTNIDWLIRIVWSQQSDFWYDPCGKSGYDINRSMTKPAAAALERIARIKGWDGKGGIE